jgi:hypothetical protein
LYELACDFFGEDGSPPLGGGSRLRANLPEVIPEDSE